MSAHHGLRPLHRRPTRLLLRLPPPSQGPRPRRRLPRIPRRRQLRPPLQLVVPPRLSTASRCPNRFSLRRHSRRVSPLLRRPLRQDPRRLSALRRNVRLLSRPLPASLVPRLSEDGSLLVSGGEDGRIIAFPILQLLDSSPTAEDDSSWPALHQVAAHELPGTAVAAGAGGCSATAVSSSLDYTCKLWRLADGTHLRTVQLPCTCVIRRLGQHRLGVVHRWVPRTRLRRSLEDQNEVGEPCSSRDVRVSSGRRTRRAVTAVAMSHWDRHLVSASEDGVMRTWEPSTWAVEQTLTYEHESISDLVVARVAPAVWGGAVGMCGGGGGFCRREMGRPVREVMEMEERLSDVGKDSRRAVDVLQGAIVANERPLRLFLGKAEYWPRCGRVLKYIDCFNLSLAVTSSKIYIC